MIYAEFHHMSAAFNGKLPMAIPMCGSDSVMILDGRLPLEDQIQLAKARAAMLNANLNKGIVGFIIHRGRSFIRSQPVTRYISL